MFDDSAFAFCGLQLINSFSVFLDSFLRDSSLSAHLKSIINKAFKRNKRLRSLINGFRVD